MLVDYLGEIGYRTLVANSGERALTQLERVQPDLILLDVMMPGIDGFETCRRIKAMPAAVDIPIIFMTALSGTQHKLDGFQAGAVDYVTKPFQQEEISARISTHLVIQPQRRELEEVNAAKDVFISVIGHDLRGPLTVLLGFSEMLADPTRELSKADRDRFGAMLRQAGIGEAVGALAQGVPGLMLLLLAFVVTASIRTLQGSATVAMITAAGVLQGFADAESLPFHPVYLAMAIGAGSKPVSWMTDSAFWIMTRMSGMTEAEGLRVISPMSIGMGLSALLFTMLFATIFPGV